MVSVDHKKIVCNTVITTHDEYNTNIYTLENDDHLLIATCKSNIDIS